MAVTFSPSYGTSIKVNINGSMTLIGGAEGVPEFGPEKGVYEVQAISDTAKQFGADIPDPGEFTITGTWDCRDAGQAYLYASATSLSAIEGFEVDYAKPQGATTGAKATFSALALSFRFSANQKKQQMYTSKIKLTGPVTLVPTS